MPTARRTLVPVVGTDVEVVAGELTDAAGLTPGLDGVDAVVMTHGAPYGSGDYEAVVDYGAVPTLLEALAGREVRVALMSSIGVTAPTGGARDILDWKRRGERLLRASGLPYTIVRPGWFDAGTASERRADLRQGDRIDYGPVRREDVAHALVQALHAPTAIGRTVEVFSVDGPPLEDWADAFAATDPDTLGPLDGARAGPARATSRPRATHGAGRPAPLGNCPLTTKHVTPEENNQCDRHSCTAPGTCGSRTSPTPGSRSRPTRWCGSAPPASAAATCIPTIDAGDGRPRRMGHEFLGVVEETGSDVTTVSSGDLVVAPFAYADTPARYCREGAADLVRHGGLGPRDSTAARASRARPAGGRHPGEAPGRGATPRLLPVPADPLRRVLHRLPRRLQRRRQRRRHRDVIGDGAVGPAPPCCRPSCWAPNGSSSWAATRPAPTSGASSAPPTSSPSAARRASPRSSELTGGEGPKSSWRPSATWTPTSRPPGWSAPAA